MGGPLGRRDLVERGYDAVADRYAALEAGNEWPRLRRLRELLALLPDGATVLDVGCGAGIPALAEIAKRHRALGIDVSGEQVRRAQTNVPAARVVHADALEFDVEPESLDAVVAFYVLDHVPREQHALLLDRFRRWLRPGGLVLFTVEVEEMPDVVGEWLGVPMFFSCFERETTLRLTAEAGFAALSSEVETQVEGDRPVDWLWVLARKSA